MLGRKGLVGLGAVRILVVAPTDAVWMPNKVPWRVTVRPRGTLLDPAWLVVAQSNDPCVFGDAAVCSRRKPGPACARLSPSCDTAHGHMVFEPSFIRRPHSACAMHPSFGRSVPLGGIQQSVKCTRIAPGSLEDGSHISDDLEAANRLEAGIATCRIPVPAPLSLDAR